MNIVPRPDGLKDAVWEAFQLLACGQSVRQAAKATDLRTWYLAEWATAHADTIQAMRAVMHADNRERIVQMVGHALDFMHDTLLDKEVAASIRLQAADSILDRAGFARQTKVETNAPPQMVIPGIERLSIEQLTALATGVTAGMRPQPAVIDVTTGDETP